jgi:hypothetical protein
MATITSKQLKIMVESITQKTNMKTKCAIDPFVKNKLLIFFKQSKIL